MERLAEDFVAAVFSAVGATLGGVWGLLPDWVHWTVWGTLALVALWVIKTIKDLGGWPLVGAALLGAVSVISGLVGFHRGVAWAERRKPVVTPKPKKKRRTLL